MPRMNLMRFLLCSATVSLALLSIGRPAQSEGRCPNEYSPVNSNGIDDGVSCTKYYYYESQLSRLRREADEFEAERARRQQEFAERLSTIKLLQDNFAEQKKLISDPKYRAYYDGSWDFLQNKNNAPGGSCAALFSKIDGLILLSGPDKNYPGVLLTFWGKDIPRPKQAEKIKVALTQDNYPPQTTPAVNYVASGIEYGAITFAVPTVEAALAQIKDVTSFDLAIEGKSVVKIKWNGGLAIRDKFRECEKARVKK